MDAELGCESRRGPRAGRLEWKSAIRIGQRKSIFHSPRALTHCLGHPPPSSLFTSHESRALNPPVITTMGETHQLSQRLDWPLVSHVTLALDSEYHFFLFTEVKGKLICYRSQSSPLACLFFFFARPPSPGLQQLTSVCGLDLNSVSRHKK